MPDAERTHDVLLPQTLETSSNYTTGPRCTRLSAPLKRGWVRQARPGSTGAARFRSWQTVNRPGFRPCRSKAFGQGAQAFLHRLAGDGFAPGGNLQHDLGRGQCAAGNGQARPPPRPTAKRRSARPGPAAGRASHRPCPAARPAPGRGENPRRPNSDGRSEVAIRARARWSAPAKGAVSTWLKAPSGAVVGMAPPADVGEIGRGLADARASRRSRLRTKAAVQSNISWAWAGTRARRALAARGEFQQRILGALVRRQPRIEQPFAQTIGRDHHILDVAGQQQPLQHHRAIRQRLRRGAWTRP